MVSDHYAFQVLELAHEGQSLFFWRTNQPKGKFLRCSDPAWQQAQDEKRRQASNARAKAHQDRGGGWSNYRASGGRSGGYSGGWSGHHGQGWQREEQQGRSGWTA